MICFCVCARDHEWHPDSCPNSPNTTVTCRCGRVLEPMTLAEHTEAIAQHEATGLRMLAANDMEPFIHLSKD